MNRSGGRGQELVRSPSGRSWSGVCQAGVRQAGVRQAGVRQEESVRQESVRQKSVRQESVRQESVRQESVRHELVRQESVRQESVRQESVRQESVRQESVRQGRADYPHLLLLAPPMLFTLWHHWVDKIPLPQKVIQLTVMKCRVYHEKSKILWLNIVISTYIFILRTTFSKQ
jgi:hypothetical protein